MDVHLLPILWMGQKVTPGSSAQSLLRPTMLAAYRNGTTTKPRQMRNPKDSVMSPHERATFAADANPIDCRTKY